jgi:chromosome segregation ATPase
MALEQLERSREGDEEAVAIRKEWDELLQRDAVARQRILELLDDVQQERDRKLAAEQRLVASETKARQDAATAERLRKERDESRQTEERLRTERGMARAEHDVACQVLDAAQQRVGSLEAELEKKKAQKLDAENASAGLAADLGREKAKALTLDKELAEVRKTLEAEASEHGMLRAAIRVICDDLEVA